MKRSNVILVAEPILKLWCPATESNCQSLITKQVLYHLTSRALTLSNCMYYISLIHTCQHIWWRISDSNRSPTACKAAALPDELIPHSLIILLISNHFKFFIFSLGILYYTRVRLTKNCIKIIIKLFLWHTKRPWSRTF